MRAFSVGLVFFASVALAADAAAQSFAGRWVFEEGGQQAVLELRQDGATASSPTSACVPRPTGGVRTSTAPSCP